MNPDERVPLPPALRGLQFEPVRPLPPPGRRALLLLPPAVLVLFAASAFFGPRPDAAALGWLLGWGASTAETVLGLALLALALREAIPGRALPRGWIGAALGLSAALVAAVSVAAFAASPIALEARYFGYVTFFCISGTLSGALPLLLLGSVLCARAFPLRPGLAGLLVGLGAGLVSDSGWRLFCHYSNPGHLALSHFGPVLLAGLCGALVGRGVAAWRRGPRGAGRNVRPSPAKVGEKGENLP